MYEMMVDLETLDTKPGATVLSIGAVVWGIYYNPLKDAMDYEVTDRFLRILDLESQFLRGSTVSQKTLLWWMSDETDPAAKAEAFSAVPGVRRPVGEVLRDFNAFSLKYKEINAFWASPDSFDFPIWEALAMRHNRVGDYHGYVPWKYNQKRDVRSVVNEANVSASSHIDGAIKGVKHAPVYDCEWQISLLTAARNKINRRIGK